MTIESEVKTKTHVVAQQNKEITAKEAAKKAIEFYKDVMNKDSTTYSLDEAELSAEGYWYITLGFLGNSVLMNRRYRVFKVDSHSGEVISMKMRE